jgi:hypothetical protein
MTGPVLMFDHIHGQVFFTNVEPSKVLEAVTSSKVPTTGGVDAPPRP